MDPDRGQRWDWAKVKGERMIGILGIGRTWVKASFPGVCLEQLGAKRQTHYSRRCQRTGVHLTVNRIEHEIWLLSGIY